MPESIVHPVPYYAQWASARLVPEIVSRRMPATEDPLWREYGASTAEEYEWWSWRLCGMACLRMALGHWGHAVPSAMELARECVDAGAYVQRGDGLDGLIYAPFAAYARQRWGLAADVRPELPAAEITKHLADGRLAIISVHPSIRHLDPAPPRKGGHLVLAVGATDDELLIHNPSGFPDHSQEFARVPWTELERFYAGRGILLGRSPDARL
ncbi:C39 family peptidase [Streptomyces sp. NPDC020681]|uniref:C39 family peptidase n=1 Tax=Streptomyces sp. NPDC020681 TaxID=3365083 RepID=UPI0037A8F1D4